ncbi:MAG TPA: helix-turn-helix domain-containing protein [Pyrinomonadaceae bacterium]|nr:helix-turn-helix domain-containing protein [Pyrinomonadaceae bacterium]
MQATDIYLNPALNLLAVLNLFGAAQGLLLSLALLSGRRGEKFTNRTLAALILTIVIVICGAVLVSTDYVFVFPHLSRLHQPFVFLAGPLLFLYIRALTSSGQRFEKKDLLHFVPFVFCVIYLLPYYFQSRAAKLNILGTEYSQYSNDQWYYIRSALSITQFFVYLILIVSILIKYSRKIKDKGAPAERAVLFQVRFFVTASLVLWVGAVLRYVIDRTAMSNLLIPFGASIMIYVMGYLEMRRPVAVETAEEQPPARKYEKSSLTPERSERYLNKLLQFMENEKPYTDGELTIQRLADRLSIPANHLSQTINEGLGQSFNDFINSYRVEEAKRRLVDPARKHYSVLAISEEVGFNSKSSFNAVFKKHVKMTPSEFRKAASLNGDH